ncbi:hypothetical protein, partial [Klebsiella pneumoniae]|uniref:hypothetical protein n=1 Tax=Klebsiella pneumoniae TaxID=573 RepID=UPI00300AF05E
PFHWLQTFWGPQIHHHHDTNQGSPDKFHLFSYESQLLCNGESWMSRGVKRGEEAAITRSMSYTPLVVVMV